MPRRQLPEHLRVAALGAFTHFVTHGPIGDVMFDSSEEGQSERDRHLIGEGTSKGIFAAAIAIKENPSILDDLIEIMPTPDRAREGVLIGGDITEILDTLYDNIDNLEKDAAAIAVMNAVRGAHGDNVKILVDDEHVH